MGEDKQNGVRTPDPFKVLRDQLTVALLAALLAGGIAYYLGRQSKIQVDTAVGLTELKSQLESLEKRLDTIDRHVQAFPPQGNPNGNHLGKHGR